MSLVAKIKSVAHVDPYGNLGREGTAGRLKKLLSPRWVLNRVALSVYEHRNPDHPWITRDATLLFEALLRPNHHGLEWGSGNGTRWIARRCESLVSIEHFGPWHARVRAQLDVERIRNVAYHLVEESRYIDSIDGFPEESLDFIVVDGLFRGPTFRRSIPKLGQGGFIVFDNANWYLPSTSRTPHSRSHKDGPVDEDFEQIMRLTSDWKLLWTTNGVNDTALFVKPVRCA